MSELLVVIDMQNDFISASLGSVQAQTVVTSVKDMIEKYRKANG